MQKKIDTLQAELQQKQAANHNHSFADSERLAEVTTLVVFKYVSSIHIHDSIFEKTPLIGKL